MVRFMVVDGGCGHAGRRWKRLHMERVREGDARACSDAKKALAKEAFMASQQPHRSPEIQPQRGPEIQPTSPTTPQPGAPPEVQPPGLPPEVQPGQLPGGVPDAPTYPEVEPARETPSPSPTPQPTHEPEPLPQPETPQPTPHPGPTAAFKA